MDLLLFDSSKIEMTKMFELRIYHIFLGVWQIEEFAPHDGSGIATDSGEVRGWSWSRTGQHLTVSARLC